MTMNLIPIADCHLHLWDLVHNTYPWLQPAEPSGPFGKSAKIRHSYLLNDYLSDTAQQKVVKAVHVEAGWDHADPVGETRWLQQLADQHGFPQGIVAHADLASPHVEATLEQHAQCANLRGIRMRLQDGNFVSSPDGGNERLRSASWRRGFSLLRKFNLSFDLQATSSVMHDGAQIAARFPDVPIIVTHAGYPLDPSPAERERWRRSMRELASHENVFVKLSGVTMGRPDWTVDEIAPVILEVIDLFGVARCLFASNFPVDRLFGSFDRLFGAYRSIVSGFSADEQRALFHDNTCRVYRI
jgi:predicted TIM-barrel fold metal-dependent hydrolase